MQSVVVEEATICGIGTDLLGRHLPFDLGREALARPLRKGLRFVIRDVGDRGLQIQWAQAAQGELAVLAFVFLPVERCLPALIVYCFPTVFKPMAKIAIGPVADKLEILPIAHQAIVQAIGGGIGLVRRAFVVVGETRALPADLL